MIYAPDQKQGLKVWVDADFAGGWIQRKLAMQNMSTLAQALLYIMLAVLYIGKVNCKQKLHYQLQRLSIFQCHKL